MDVQRARAAHLCSQSPKRCIIITPFPYMRYANGLLALRNAMRQCEFDSHIIRGILRQFSKYKLTEYHHNSDHRVGVSNRRSYESSLQV